MIDYHRPPQKNGFTLIELLVALVMSSIVAYLLFSTIQITQSNTDSVQFHHRKLMLQERARYWLSESVKGFVAQRRHTPIFNGTDKWFEGYSSLPLLGKSQALTKVRWELQEYQGNQRLLYIEYLPEETQTLIVWESDILTGPTEFKYFDVNLGQHAIWNSGERLRLPELVVLVSKESEQLLWVNRIYNEKTLPLDLNAL